MKPTYVGIEGDGYPDDYKKCGSRVHQKLVNAGFDGISGLSIVVNPQGSDEPSYDNFATISFGFIESIQEATLCFVVNELFVQFASGAYDDAWKTFLDLNTWDFGYGFSGNVEKQPEFHILGLDNGNLTATEQSELNAWYGALPDQRLDRLRGIYTYNFVSMRQLDNDVINGVTLRQFIEQRQLGEIRLLTDYGLHLWRLDEAEVDQARMQLQESAVLISA